MRLLIWMMFAVFAMVAPAFAEVPPGRTRTGIDVLIAKKFDVLQGRNVGLITNHTGRTRDGVPTIDVLAKAPGVKLVALFSPEHGIRGTEDTKVDSEIDAATGLKVHSLYGKTRRPTPEMLNNLDTLVFDIQDIGTRFYAYISTMSYAMEVAKENGLRIVILDRPNPINGVDVEGAIPPDDAERSFTSVHPIPTRHGMTVGELAQLFNTEFGIGADLIVVPMENWTRPMYWDETGLLWINPSPNMRTLLGAVLYPGPGQLETTSLSVGRGLDRPFEMYGAPYLDGEKAAQLLNVRALPGLRFVPTSFTPTAPYHNYKDQLCKGVFVVVYDRDAVEGVRTALHMAQVFHEVAPVEYKATSGFKTHVGDPEAWALLTEEKMTPEAVMARWEPRLEAFRKMRAKYLLY